MSDGAGRFRTVRVERGDDQRVGLFQPAGHFQHFRRIIVDVAVDGREGRTIAQPPFDDIVETAEQAAHRRCDEVRHRPAGTGIGDCRPVLARRDLERPAS